MRAVEQPLHLSALGGCWSDLTAPGVWYHARSSENKEQSARGPLSIVVGDVPRRPGAVGILLMQPPRGTHQAPQSPSYQVKVLRVAILSYLQLHLYFYLCWPNAGLIRYTSLLDI